MSSGTIGNSTNNAGRSLYADTSAATDVGPVSDGTSGQAQTPIDTLETTPRTPQNRRGAATTIDHGISPTLVASRNNPTQEALQRRIETAKSSASTLTHEFANLDTMVQDHTAALEGHEGFGGMAEAVTKGRQEAGVAEDFVHSAEDKLARGDVDGAAADLVRSHQHINLAVDHAGVAAAYHRELLDDPNLTPEQRAAVEEMTPVIEEVQTAAAEAQQSIVEAEQAIFRYAEANGIPLPTAEAARNTRESTDGKGESAARDAAKETRNSERRQAREGRQRSKTVNRARGFAAAAQRFAAKAAQDSQRTVERQVETEQNTDRVRSEVA